MNKKEKEKEQKEEAMNSMHTEQLTFPSIKVTLKPININTSKCQGQR